LKDFTFCEGEPDNSYTWGFEQSLFNSHAHRALQSDHGWLSFYALDAKEKKIVASIHFHVSGNLASSPLKAPFGSLEFAPALPYNTLFEFIQYMEVRLQEHAVKKIVIKTAPELYSDNPSILNTFFINLKYNVVNSEIAAGIPVSANSIDETLHRSERRRLEKARAAGLYFREVPLQELTSVYHFIAACRAEKSFQLSMPFHDLQQTVNVFPDRYFLFGVYLEDRLVAASVCILVNKHVLYDFYHDHSREHDSVSPVVMLVAGIYEFCHRRNISILDLGTSALDGKPNFSLLNFKLLLGGRPSGKLTFQKVLS
jgi:hypothetical protein